MARWTLPLVVIGAVIAYLTAAFVADIDEVIQPVRRLDGGTWFTLLTLSLINYGLRFGRWHVYLQELGHRVPVGRHLAIYISGFALTPTPGKVGEGIRALYLKPFGISFGRTVSALYAERVLDVIAVSVLAALLCFAPVSGFQWLAAGGGVVAIALIVIQHPAILKRRLGSLRHRWLRPLAQRVAAFQRDVTSLVRGRRLLYGLAVGLVAWGAEGLGLYLVADALDIDMALGWAMGIYAASMLAGALSIIPGGLGSAEAMMVALLALIGVPMPTAIAITLVVRVATLWFAVALGAVSLLGLEAGRCSIPAAEIGQDRN